MEPLQERENGRSKLPFSKKIEQDVPLSSIVNSKSEVLSIYIDYKKANTNLLNELKTALEIDLRLNGKMTGNTDLDSVSLDEKGRKSLIDLKNHTLFIARQEADQIEYLSKKMLRINPLDPGLKDFVTKNISSTSAKLDLLYVLAHDSDARKGTNILESFDKLYNNKNSDYINSAETIENVHNYILKYENSLPEHLKYSEKDEAIKNELSELKSKNDYLSSIDKIDNFFINHIDPNNRTQNKLVDASKMLENKSLMEDFNFSYPTSPKLLSSNPIDQDVDSMPKNILWDRQISWTGQLDKEADIRVIQTAHSSIKRLATLLKSLKTALTEVDEGSSDTRVNKRLETLDSFWSKYHETGRLITEEFISTIKNIYPELKDEKISDSVFIKSILEKKENNTEQAKLIKLVIDKLIERGDIKVSEEALDLRRRIDNNSIDLTQAKEIYNKDYSSKLIENNTYNKISTTLVPYQYLLKAISTVPINSQNNLYKENDFVSSESSYEVTHKAVNDTIKNIRHELSEMGCTDKNLDLILQDFKRLNENNRESIKANSWVDNFRIRFPE